MTEIVVLTKDELKKLICQVIRQELRLKYPGDEIGGVELAERITGLKAKTIYKKAADREIPYFQEVKGDKITFSRKDLEVWQSKRRKKTRTELREELTRQ